jgi:hypothetical protein
VTQASGRATPETGTRSAGQGVLSTSTTHEVTGRVLRTSLRPPGAPRLAADCHCLIDPSRQRQRLDQPRLSSGAPVTIVEQPDGAAERVDSGCQPPSLE